MNELLPYLLYWRTARARGREVVEAVVHPDHRGPSPALREALESFPGLHYWATRGDAGRLVLIQVHDAPRAERWWLHGLLFAATFLTAWVAGAYLSGVSTNTIGVLGLLGGSLEWVRLHAVGLPYAMALMGILLSHEMGHYFAAKRYGIDASPPYFLPAPILLTFIGTFGAFIRLRSPIVDRRQLMDVGAAGPWAGFIVSMLMLVVGLARSEIVPTGDAAAMVVEMAGGTYSIGDSLVTLVLRKVMIGDGTVVLHQLAVAGWVGVLVTALNLLPLGQLDGGHIVYALLGRHQRIVGVLFWIGLVVIGWLYFFPWLIWAGLILLLGGGRVSHPRVLEPRRPIPLSRWPAGWLSMALFVITFAPRPILNIGGLGSPLG